ncbi:zinc finger, Ran-binding protein (macronuclear) [Tetrahymena thermophila SB210]|uniref:Zinc finger, Ran-binding protein n=1 Tax=Tetrahymena thermophila (strain SB210) TaxID=312017 RepID=I7MHZ8_TETTS|nr:zinc finger, Ran-binding protein [Tetrahymena thermophila SB210]EAS03776.2 zinc finger, Ran-binding protein [Tetrahymena thermophila SB210]|eukprot:XP_001024021.2 zinc finger, Ran-binding protein [Tetrahymena thermophila SB210]
MFIYLLQIFDQLLINFDIEIQVIRVVCLLFINNLLSRGKQKKLINIKKRNLTLLFFQQEQKDQQQSQFKSHSVSYLDQLISFTNSKEVSTLENYNIAMKKKQTRQQPQFQKQQSLGSTEIVQGSISTSSTSQQQQQALQNQLSNTCSNQKVLSCNPNSSPLPLANGVGQVAVGSQNQYSSASLAGNINCNQLRAGDWVCLLCNNLNFSFRNECNRCMIQTKKQNLLQNLMLVQEGQQFFISDNDQNNVIAENGISENNNLSPQQDKKEEENLLEYAKYQNRAGAGFENMLLLLTPNRSSIHSDDCYDHKMNTTATGPQSHNSNSKSDPDQSSKNNKKNKVKNMMINDNSSNYHNSNKANQKMQFEEDIFSDSSNKHEQMKPLGAMLDFSSPEVAKYAYQKQDQIDEISFQNSVGTFAPYCDQKLAQQNSKQLNKDIQPPLQEEKREFQLFGSNKPSIDYPNFILSPSSMRDGDESLNESDSGNFQQEIQQQINNIIMEEEDDYSNKRQNQEEQSQQNINKQNNQMEVMSYYNSEAQNSSAVQSLNLINPTQKNEDQHIYSFGAGFQQNQRNGNNLFSRQSQQVDMNSTDKLINLQSNQNNQQQQSRGLFFQYNNNNNNNINNNTGFFNYFSNSNAQQVYGEQPTNNLKANNSNNSNNNGINFSNYSSFLNSNQFTKSSNQLKIKEQSDNNNNDANSQKSNSNSIRSLFMNQQNTSLWKEESQFSLFSNQNTSAVVKSTLFNVDENSNTLPSQNVFNKIAKFDNFYKKEDLINQNTVNFEQASSFINKGKQKNTGKGTVLYSVNDDYADMSDSDDDEGDSNSESRIMRSTKKSNNIRKKRKQGNNVESKKKSKIQHHQSNAINTDNNLSNNFNSPNVAYNYSQNFLYKDENSIKEACSLSLQQENQSISQNNNFNSMQTPLSNPHNNSLQGQQSSNNNSQGQQVNAKKQDWICPRCTNLNYSFRKLCNKCQFAKNNFAILIPPNFQQIQQQLTIF